MFDIKLNEWVSVNVVFQFFEIKVHFYFTYKNSVL